MNGRVRICVAYATVLSVACSCMALNPRSFRRRTKATQYRSRDWSQLWASFPRADFVGPAICAGCHPFQAAYRESTEMSRAAFLPSNPEGGAGKTALGCRLGPYTFRVVPTRNSVLFSVDDGRRTISEPIIETFGSGIVGQTYLLNYRGSYFEGRVSYYTRISGLEITIGQPATVPSSIEDALGRRLNPAQAERCFSCHNTAAVTSGQLHPEEMIPGVTCEACHGPGAKHAEAEKAGDLQVPTIFNPARLDPGKLNDFCGSCHETSAQVRARGIKGPENARFAPYRLAKSRCWNAHDARIQCTACHDPHRSLARGAAAYDSRCLGCHATQAGSSQTGKRGGPPCRISTRDCTTCHMPKIKFNGDRFSITDHMIRIVRAGEKYPS